MRIRLLLCLTATVALAACGESNTSPQAMRPDTRSNDMLMCRTGYHIATRADGTSYCEPDAPAAPMTAPAKAP